MYMLDSKWPSLESITGVDLSTYKLAIAEEKKASMVRVLNRSRCGSTLCRSALY